MRHSKIGNLMVQDVVSVTAETRPTGARSSCTAIRPAPCRRPSRRTMRGTSAGVRRCSTCGCRPLTRAGNRSPRCSRIRAIHGCSPRSALPSPPARTMISRSSTPRSAAGTPAGIPITGEEIPADILDGLHGAALLEGARLLVPDAWHVQAVLDLVHDAEYREALDPEVREEIPRWTWADTGEDASRREGIPDAAFGPRQRNSTSPVRDFAGHRAVPGRGSAMFEQHPHLALLGTSNDRPADWL